MSICTARQTLHRLLRWSATWQRKRKCRRSTRNSSFCWLLLTVSLMICKRLLTKSFEVRHCPCAWSSLELVPTNSKAWTSLMQMKLRCIRRSTRSTWRLILFNLCHSENSEMIPSNLRKRHLKKSQANFWTISKNKGLFQCLQLKQAAKQFSKSFPCRSLSAGVRKKRTSSADAKKSSCKKSSI